nr:hypothetical protein [Clostridia bacterium]
MKTINAKSSIPKTVTAIYLLHIFKVNIFLKDTYSSINAATKKLPISKTAKLVPIIPV